VFGELGGGSRQAALHHPKRSMSKLKREGGKHYNNQPVFAIVSEGKNTQRRLCDCGFWKE